jgi:hypothetical protein
MGIIYGKLRDKFSYEKQWQYNGAAPIEEILEWCENTLPAHTFGWYGWETIYFFDESMYALFLVRWAT